MSARKDGTSLMDTARLADVADRYLDATHKSLPLAPSIRLRAGDIAHQKWNVRAGDLDFPTMIVKEDQLASNIAVMAEYCRRRNLFHAPHGKTSMSPQLFKRQFDAGVWAITAANAAQCRAYRFFGVQRILLANVLVDAQSLRWIAEELQADSDFEFLCYVDSVRGVEMAAEALAQVGGSRPLEVLVEFGYQGGRTGCRTTEGALEVANEVRGSKWLKLRGVAGFEGLMPGRDMADVIEQNTLYLVGVRDVVNSLDSAGFFAKNDEVIVTSGGSSYFDLVAEILGPDQFARPVRTVIRSGCYVTHDAEMFELTSPLAARAKDPGDLRLESAFELWATVWSLPEPGLAIVGFGKRDAPYDYGLPLPQRVHSHDDAIVRDVRGAYTITALNDQHAFMTIPSHDSLRVGDRVVLEISHPCGAFDKWRYVPVVDNDYNVVDGLFTFF